MRLLITGIIVFLILFYFYLIWPRLSRKRQICPFLHTMFAHRGYHCIEKGIPENGNPFDDTSNLAVILAYNRPKYNKQIIAY